MMVLVVEDPEWAVINRTATMGLPTLPGSATRTLANGHDLLLMIEFLHDLIYQNVIGNNASIVDIGTCRVSIMKSSVCFFFNWGLVIVFTSSWVNLCEYN